MILYNNQMCSIALHGRFERHVQGCTCTSEYPHSRLSCVSHNHQQQCSHCHEQMERHCASCCNHAPGTAKIRPLRKTTTHARDAPQLFHRKVLLGCIVPSAIPKPQYRCCCVLTIPGIRLFTSGRMTSSRFLLKRPKQYSNMFLDLPGFRRVSVPA